jgi:hypothetical protein
MKKLLIGLLLLILIPVSVVQASDETKSFQVGTRYIVGDLLTASKQSFSVTEFKAIGFVAELYLEWKPLQTFSWLGLEISGLIGNATPYDLGDVSQVIAPTVTLKVHPFKLSWVDFYGGVGAQYEQISGEYQFGRNKYQVSGGGVSPILQLGFDVPVFEGLSLGVDLKYTPTSTITVNWSQDDQTVIREIFRVGVGGSYSF